MKFGIFFVALILLSGLVGPALISADPNSMDLARQFEAPSSTHLFGLDQNGSDVLAKVLYGARISILVSISVTGICLFVGLMMGSLAGWLGGKTDALIMRLVDILFAFPGFLFAIAMVAALGPGVDHLVFAMCFTGWAGYARLVRGEVLHLRTKEYIQSARSLGLPDILIVWKYIWPNLAAPLLVHATFAMAGVVIAESSLSFLGLGASPETPTWGALLNSGRQYLIEAPHISLFPGLALLTLVLGFNFIGDGLRDRLDPKHQS